MITPIARRVHRRVAIVGLVVLVWLIVYWVARAYQLSELSVVSLVRKDGFIAFLVLVVPTTLCVFVVSRVTQVILVGTYLVFGSVSPILAASGQLTGLVIYGFGVLLAGEFGWFRRRPAFSVPAAMAPILAAMLIALFMEQPDASLLEAINTVIAVAAITYLYATVIGIRVADSGKRQNQLQEQVDWQTAELQRENARRTLAEEAARASARANKNLANERLQLIQQLQHRTNNSLQMILMLIEAQPDESEFGNSVNARGCLVARIRAIASVYRLVDQGGHTDRVDSGELVSFVAQDLSFGSWRVGLAGVSSVPVAIDAAVSLSLLLAEFIVASGDRTSENSVQITLDQEQTERHLLFTVSYFSRERDGTSASISSQVADTDLGAGLLRRLHANATRCDDRNLAWMIEIPLDVLRGNIRSDTVRADSS